MNYLLDTGFLYASINAAEPRNTVTIEILSRIRGDIILPSPAITEIAYLLKRDLGVTAAAKFIESLADSKLIIESPESVDFQRVADLSAIHD